MNQLSWFSFHRTRTENAQYVCYAILQSPFFGQFKLPSGNLLFIWSGQVCLYCSVPMCITSTYLVDSLIVAIKTARSFSSEYLEDENQSNPCFSRVTLLILLSTTVSGSQTNNIHLVLLQRYTHPCQLHWKNCQVWIAIHSWRLLIYSILIPVQRCKLQHFKQATIVWKATSSESWSASRSGRSF